MSVDYSSMTKGAIKKRCREILYKNKYKYVTDKDEYDFIIGVLEKCSTWEEKNEGHKLIGISSKQNLEHPETTSFYLHFDDDFEGCYGEDISFYDSDYIITPKTRMMRNIKNACRTAERERTEMEKDKCLINGVFICPETGLNIFSRTQIEIHHEISPNSKKLF